MGNTHSRQRQYYLTVAEEAYEAAYDAYEIIGGPRPRGAILAYLEQRISKARMLHDCTQVEVSLSLL